MRFRGRGRNRLPELEWRKRATAATLAHFRDRTFDWQAGVTCMHLAVFHMRRMGHRPPALPRFRSAAGARKALDARGFASVSAALDSLLLRVAPSMMWLGDLAVVEGSDGMESIMVCTGPQALLGWLPGGERMMAQIGGLAQVKAAWRV